MSLEIKENFKSSVHNFQVLVHKIDLDSIEIKAGGQDSTSRVKLSCAILCVEIPSDLLNDNKAKVTDKWGAGVGL